MLETLMKFGVVGGLGVVVNLSVLALMRWMGCSDTVASAIAIEISIISNFVLNERWTFQARVAEHQGRGWGRRMWRFQLVSSVGAVLQWSTFVALNVLWAYLEIGMRAETHSWVTYQTTLNQGAWHHVITTPPQVGDWVYLSQLIGIGGATAWNFLANYYWTWAAEHPRSELN